MEPITIRAIRPDDGERLRAAHDRLSPEAQYRRFLTPKPHLSGSDVRYLVDVDGERHLALVATPAGDPKTIVAVARFVRLPDDPEAAEFAIVVADGHQRQGLGTQLLDELIAAARARGVRRFVATVLTDNRAAQRLIRRAAGSRGRSHLRGLVTELEFELEPAMIAACPGS